MSAIDRAIRFDSLGAFADAAEQLGKSNQSSHQRGDDWSGASFDGSLTLARDGWSEHRDTFDAIAADVLTKVEAATELTIDRQLGLAGGAVDMGRYLLGRPDCLWQTVLEEAPAQGPVVTVLVSFCASAAVEAETMLRRGAAVLALVDILDRLGASTEIVCESTVGRARDQVHSTLVNIKGASEPLDLDAIAFGLAHPAMLRRLGFAVQEGEPADVVEAFGFHSSGGYGMPKAPMRGDALGATVVLDTVSHADRTLTDPVGWVLDALRSSGYGEAIA